VSFKPSQVDSVLSQLELLSRIAKALSLPGANRTGELSRIAQRLSELLHRLQPDRRLPKDLLPDPAPAEVPAPAQPPRTAGKKPRKSRRPRGS
jgi:hypothetical protein